MSIISSNDVAIQLSVYQLSSVHCDRGNSNKSLKKSKYISHRVIVKCLIT